MFVPVMACFVCILFIAAFISFMIAITENGFALYITSASIVLITMCIMWLKHDVDTYTSKQIGVGKVLRVNLRVS
jgi:hypothetical protein